MRHLIAGGGLLLAAAAPALAADTPFDACQGPFTFVPSDATYEDFDFWVGTWQVIDTATGQLRGFDDIKYIADGCVLQQSWNQMDDLFQPTDSPMRLRGHTLTGIDAKGRWRQMWTDNTGSNIVLTGGLQADGTMQLVSEWIDVPSPSGKQQVRYLWNWQPQADGTIHNWGSTQTGNETGPTSKYFDITYMPHKMGGPAFNLRVPEEQ